MSQTTDRRDENVDKLRASALASPYAFGKIVCGFADLDADFHGAMSRWVMRPSRRKLMLAPRGHLKSSVVTIADSLRRVTIDPNMRLAIVNETERLPSKWLGQMQAIVESPIYRFLFADRVPDLANAKVKWNATQLTLKREMSHAQATIEAFGVGGASTGNHYEFICEDDLVGKEARESALVMSKAIDQHKLAESLLVDPGRDAITTVGTRWHVNDLAAWMLTHEPEVDFIKFSWRKPDGTPVWPDRFNEREVERLRKKYGTHFFLLMYENEAIAEGTTSLRGEWLRAYTLGAAPDGEPTIKLDRPASEGGPKTFAIADCTLFMVVDPALSPDSDADRTALVTVALTPERPFSVVVLDAIAKRVPPKRLIDETYQAYLRWRPSVVGIEVVAAQVAFYYWIPTVYPDLPLRRLKTSTRKSKETRIREAAVVAEQGRVYVRHDQIDFIDEWETFPQGRTVDLLDAFAYMSQIWFPPDQGSHDSFDESDGSGENDEIPPWANGRAASVTGYGA